MSSVDDIAYLYLDLAKQLDLKGAVLVGSCFGGWVAAEMAVRDTLRFGKLVLAAPLGAKFGGLHDRDIADMHGMAGPRSTSGLGRSGTRRGRLHQDAGDRDRRRRAGAGVPLFGWKLRIYANLSSSHWLHRIDIPTLVLWGERDRIVNPSSGANGAIR